MARRRKLRLVSSRDPSSIFDDLDALREQSKPTPSAPVFQGARRPRSTETFARIPHDRARALCLHLTRGKGRVGKAVFPILIELDRLILEGRGRNPVKLTTATLTDTGLTRWQVYHGLRQLEDAGVITVERWIGRCPMVLHGWFPIQR
jgi:hypothetical protein